MNKKNVFVVLIFLMLLTTACTEPTIDFYASAPTTPQSQSSAAPTSDAPTAIVTPTAAPTLAPTPTLDPTPTPTLPATATPGKESAKEMTPNKTKPLSSFTGDKLDVTVDKVCFYADKTEVYVTTNLIKGDSTIFHASLTPTLIVGDNSVCYNVFDFMNDGPWDILPGVKKQFTFELPPIDYVEGAKIAFTCAIMAYPGKNVYIELQ